MIGKYLTSRLKPGMFLLLAALFSLFVTDTKSGQSSWVYNILFLFVSFLVFRFIDDAGSVSVDRKEHPERTYLNTEQYPSFVRWTIVLTAIYLLTVWLIDLRIFGTLFALITVSAGLYFIFREQKFLLGLIPLLKYPVLLWCLVGFSTDLDITAPLIATFFIIFTHDALEKVRTKQFNLVWAIVPLMISSILVFRPWNDPAILLFILPVLALVFIFYRSKMIPYVPILYFPILAFILNIN